MRQRPGVIDERAQVANINPPAAIGASDMVISRIMWKMAEPLVQVLATRNGPIEIHASNQPKSQLSAPFVGFDKVLDSRWHIVHLKIISAPNF